jgi:hypothetical protein
MSQGAKNIRLHSPLSKETISAIASETSYSGGWVEAFGDNAEPGIGAVMPDGTICVGISPHTKKPMYAMPADAPLTMTFNQAKRYAARRVSHGHGDWRLPTDAELDVPFNYRAAIGGFNVSGSNPVGWYCSATPVDKWLAWRQRFSDGYQHGNSKGNHSSVRLVRTEAPKPTQTKEPRNRLGQLVL